jgi:hypothetical protein
VKNKVPPQARSDLLLLLLLMVDPSGKHSPQTALGSISQMKLPNAENAAVQREKVADYLLNAAHPDNGGKAAFFEALGFHPAEPERLAKALKDLAR